MAMWRNLVAPSGHTHDSPSTVNVWEIVQAPTPGGFNAVPASVRCVANDATIRGASTSPRRAGG